MGLVTTLFSNTSNPLAIFSCLMVGIVPWLGKALVGIGGSLLKGIFAGKGKKQEDKREWEKFMKKYGLYQERMTQLKPTQAYSRGIDPVVQQAIANTFQERGMINPYAQAGGQVQLGGGQAPQARQAPPRVARPRRRIRRMEE